MQLRISAAALKCGVRVHWIGWDFRSEYGRLNLIANDSCFLILPEWYRPNVLIMLETVLFFLPRVYGSAVLAATHIFFDQRLTRRGDEALFRRLEPLGEQARLCP